jgi:hypothetical protein
MNIKPLIYETLTPRQRVIAAVEADARGDGAEFERLKDTCPTRIYKMTDSAYVMTMTMLVNISMLVECEIRSHLADLLFGLFIDKDEKSDQLIDISFQRIANIKAAWVATIEGMGISPESMIKVGMQPHLLLEFFSDFVPEPKAEGVKPWQDCFEGLLRRAID